MTKATAYFLDRLRVHLLDHGPAERGRLTRFYRSRIKKPLPAYQLSRWLNLKQCPSMDAGLVLLAFAKRRGLIGEAGQKTQLFVYPPPPPAVTHLRRYAAAGKKAA